jgi:hypothetical protein
MIIRRCVRTLPHLRFFRKRSRSPGLNPASTRSPEPSHPSMSRIEVTTALSRLFRGGGTRCIACWASFRHPQSRIAKTLLVHLVGGGRKAGRDLRSPGRGPSITQPVGQTLCATDQKRKRRNRDAADCGLAQYARHSAPYKGYAGRLSGAGRPGAHKVRPSRSRCLNVLHAPADGRVASFFKSRCTVKVARSSA